MSEEGAAPPPIPPFKDAVADRAKTTRAVVDLVLADVGADEEKSVRRADNLAIRRLSFSGEKKASGIQDGRYSFLWDALAPGLWGVLSEGANQIGKSTVLEVMLWALRGRTRSLKPEVRAWIDEVELEFTIGAEVYCVSFSDFDAIPRGKLVMSVPGPVRTLDTFEGDEAFESLMGDLMMRRFALQPIPNVSHTGDEATQYVHAWTAYVASMFIEGSHPAILGDVTVGALWWRMLHLFVGMPYAAAHMALRNAITLGQAQRDNAVTARSVQQNYAADIRRLEGELRRVETALKGISAEIVSSRELDDMTMESATLTREVTELQAKLASAQLGSSSLKAQKDEARAVVRRLSEGAASRRVFAGLSPVCCPRCASSFDVARTEVEETEGRCAVCDRTTLGDDEAALQDAMAAANERVRQLTDAEIDANGVLKALNAALVNAQNRRAASAAKIRSMEVRTKELRRRRELDDSALRLNGALEQLRKLNAQTKAHDKPDEERATVLKAAEVIAEARMKAASAELFAELEGEVVSIANRFGFRGLQEIAIRGNGITLTVSGIQSGYGKQTAGQRLRLRIALIIAMMRMAHRSGFGHHPGLLFIDSPGSEELSDADLVAMMHEIGEVAKETPNLQIFVASARGDLLGSAFDPKNLRLPDASGTIF